MNHEQKPSNRFSAANIALYGFLAIAAFYLITEHRAHLLGWLPWLLILACPLLHVFMHGKHGGHGGHGDDESSSSSPPGQSPHQH
ncbi:MULTISPECIES: DUF2933 domain-containing protein [Hyphomicrobiales]|uniref:DUF2933 domain-containing protein n=3 Tax=Hyphomicrobiales TaxID=356 RepID=A0A4Q0MEE7_9HYPH|nr:MULTISPECIES: DUF2933 domain-containing protein [Hyphomicrobiales]RXF71533.1 DUF2933 domain-containing protein [Hansschlegelia zhihuaiae]